MADKSHIAVALGAILTLLSATTSLAALSPVTAPRILAHAARVAVDPKPTAPFELPVSRERLGAVMGRFGAFTFVPYVWGGNTIGSQDECQACRVCIQSKPRLSVERRMRACEPCRSCGIDCSHFVQTVYREAGLSFPYATTSKLIRSTARALREKYKLIDVGRDLSAAKPGDLLVHPKHVVMLVGMHDDRYGDILHSSRANEAGGVGGIEILRNQDLKRFRGRLVRILRHEQLFNGPLPALPAVSERSPAQRHKKTRRGRRNPGIALIDAPPAAGMI